MAGIVRRGAGLNEAAGAVRPPLDGNVIRPGPAHLT
jgi:hypothetical protein